MNLFLYRDLIVGRLLLSGITYLLIFGMASIIGAEKYGEIAFYIYLVKSIPLFSIGLAQGIIYKEYEDSGVTIRSYTILYTFVCCLVLFLYGFIHGLAIVLVAIPLCFLHIVEPFLKTRKDFLAILYIELFCAFSFLLVWFFWGGVESFKSQVGLLVVSIILTLLFSYSRLKLLIDFKSELLTNNFSFAHVKELVKRGFGSYLFNFGYFLFLFVDRTLLNKFYNPDEFSSIMLAFQLSLVAGFIPVAINSRAVIDLGDEFKKSVTVRNASLAKRLVSMILINSLFVFLVVFIYNTIGGYFFPGYKDVEKYLIIFGFSIVAFNGYGAIAPVIFYMKKQLIPALLMLSSALFIVFFHLYGKAIKLPLIVIELINFSTLSVVCVLCIYYVFIVVRKEGS